MGNVEKRIEGLDDLSEATSLDTLSNWCNGVVSNCCAGLEELGGSSAHGGGQSQDMRDLERNHCEESESSESLRDTEATVD